MVFACERIFARTLFFYWVIARHSIILRAQRKGRGWFRELRFVAGKARKFAQVGEWLKPTDCKSVPPCEVRRFESFPVHQLSRLAGVKPTLSLSRGRLGASWRSPERSLRRIWQ